MGGVVVGREEAELHGRLRHVRTAKAASAPAPVALIMSAALIACIVIVATTMSMGFARAQTLNAISEPDTGLVLAMLAGAIGVMGLLSALAVRLAGRPRQR
jgi:hypothetical protein